MTHRTTFCGCLVIIGVVLISVGIASADVLSQSGISYSYGVAPSAAYPDSTGKMLTDGVSISTGDFTKCAGWQSVNTSINHATVNFDLGNTYVLDQIQINYGVYGVPNVTGWTDWTVTLSNHSNMSDPVFTKTFSSSDLTTAKGWYQCNFGDSLYAGYWGLLDIAPTGNSRYVQIVGTSKMSEITWEGNTFTEGWGMISEVQFSQVVPEPSSIIMSIAGMIGLLAYAWRKRK